MKSEENKTGRLILLVILLGASYTSYTLLIRQSQGILKEDYIKTTAVCMMESIKWVFTVIMVTITTPNSRVEHFKNVILKCYWMIPPALLYFVINFFYFYSLRNLQAPVFSILNQTKILTTGLFSVIFLKSKLTIRHWIGLGILTIGVILVLWKNEADEEKKNNLSGIITAFASVVLSGIAAVYFEGVIKAKTTALVEFSLWDRNLQLYSWSVFFSFLYSVIMDNQRIINEGFFTGYSFWTWSSVGMGAFMGTMVALVVLYGSSIVKSFAVSCATVSTGILSWYFFGFELTVMYILGTALVVLSVLLYRGDLNKILFAFIKKKKNEEVEEGDDEERV